MGLNDDLEEGNWLSDLMVIFFVFAGISLATAAVAAFWPGETLLEETIAPEETVLGPIRIDDGHTVLAVEVRQSLPLDAWDFVTVNLLDERKRYLTGFGDEFWHEEGRDSDGHWEEAETDFTGKVTVREPGEYYLRIKPESNLAPDKLRRHELTVAASTVPFSAIPHLGAGLVGLALGILLAFASDSRMANWFRKK